MTGQPRTALVLCCARVGSGMSGTGEIDHLIGRVALHDRAAFGALYDATSAKLFGICLRVLQDRAEAVVRPGDTVEFLPPFAGG